MGRKLDEKKKSITLVDCLNLFVQDERLGPNDTWYCPKCKEFQQGLSLFVFFFVCLFLPVAHVPFFFPFLSTAAMKKFDLWSVPNILVVHLKRFLHNKWSREKITTEVNFPIEGLDLSPYLRNKQEKAPIYDLFAISVKQHPFFFALFLSLSLTHTTHTLAQQQNHTGGLGGGHYYSYAKNKFDGRWYCFNDSSCSSISASEIITSNAYVLFYKRRNV
jgi:ubiquitin carboxyl-terminal hydrolase 4/11/15